jgi:hypothetical protein
LAGAPSRFCGGPHTYRGRAYREEVARQFIRTTEDFDCLVCGTRVRGDGYTNHCPRCLYSRHVDIAPGDRAEECQGLMRPIAVEVLARETMLTHVCERCGHRRRNRVSPADDSDVLLRVAREAAAAAVGGGVDGALAAGARSRRRRR